MKTQKFSLIAVLAAASLVALSATARADDTNTPSSNTPPPQGAERRPNMRRASPEQRLNHMAEALKLTDEQKDKVKAVLQAEGEKMRGLRDLAPDERREKAKAVREETVAKMKDILTAEQFTKWQEMRQNRGGGNRAPGGNARPPSQN